MAEEFRNIEGYEGLYQVSNFGRVINTTSKKILKGDIGTNGKTRVALKGRKIFVHILVAKAFPEICGAWFEGCEVHHKDHNPSNNVATNLICLTKEEHLKEHMDSLKQFGKRMSVVWANMSEEEKQKIWDKGRTKLKKPVSQFSLNGKLLKEYDSCNSAARENQFEVSAINRCCLGKQKTSYGYIWKYKGAS